MVRIVGFDRTRFMAYRSGFNWACWALKRRKWGGDDLCVNEILYARIVACASTFSRHDVRCACAAGPAASFTRLSGIWGTVTMVWMNYWPIFAVTGYKS